MRDSSSSPIPDPLKTLDEDLIEESITVASPALINEPTTSLSAALLTPNEPTLDPDFVYMAAASPTTSSSSLSEPPSEPSSPGLFALDRPNSKTEPAEEDGSSIISSQVAEFIPPNSTFTVASTFARSNGSQSKPRMRGVDPCADSDMVEAMRVANAIANTEDENENFTIAQLRNLRTSDRLGRSKSTHPVAGSPHQSSPINKHLGVSKRGRSSLPNRLTNLTPDKGLAIKQELLESNEIATNTLHQVVFPNLRKKKTKKPPVKRQKVNPTPKSTSDSIPGFTKYITPEKFTLNSGEIQQGSIATTANKTISSKVGKKGVKRKRSYQSWVELRDFPDLRPENEQAEVQQERCKFRASVPPSFTFRHASPFNPGNKLLSRLRAWSEGAEDSRTQPIASTYHMKEGILTNALITQSRLSLRKLAGNPNLQPPKSRQPRKRLNIKGEPGLDLEADPRPPKPPKKRTLQFTDEDTNESSDDLTTEDEYLEDGKSDTPKKTNDGEDGLEEEIEDEYTIMSIKTEEGQHLEGGLRKRQKLNPDDKGPITDIKDLDPRLWPGVATLVGGIYMIPRSCHFCLARRQFCNRNTPCRACTSTGQKCIRDDGLQNARERQKRVANKSDGFDGALQLSKFSQSPQPHKRRGRPPKSIPPTSPSALLPYNPISTAGPKQNTWAKKIVMNKVKKEKDIKEVPMINLIDPQEGKPQGIRRPDVWCESRQELCESLPYYRSYQSGCYGHDGLIHGYLLDGFASPRDYCDGKVVISHSGGKSAADDDGQRRLLTNQSSDDKVIKYLLANMKNQLPLVMIMGNQCSGSPSKLPHRYCVMDWFKVSAGWAERDPRSRFTRWKFRFEKLDTSIDGWWASAPTVEDDYPVEMVKASCNVCKTESPHVYQEGWMCLTPECVRFWTLNGKDAPANVKYTENFLRCRTPWPTEFLTAPSPLKPTFSPNRDVFFDGGDVSRVFWKGMCCPECGRLNCREFWAGWRCLSCDFKFDPPRTIFDAARLADPHRPVFTGPAIPANLCHDEITYQRFVRDGMTVIQYQLGTCGTVTHILANQSSNSRPKDANWLFEMYQSKDMPFKRFALGNHKAQGRLLTQQFTFNCGAPYKFIVDVESYPFDKSPPVVSRALEVIHERVNLVHPEAQFNEVLNVGYFEKQKMDYHDDGEVGLGETVASISLGAPARMRFRIKARYSRDRHCWTTNPVTPSQKSRFGGFYMKNEPKNDEGLDLGDEDEDEDLEPNEEVIGGQQPLSPPGRGPKKLNKGRVKLDLCLSHGDVMVMKGRDIQKYWEHSVIPQGLFRIAATARFIGEQHQSVLNKIKVDTAEIEELATKTEVIEGKTIMGAIPEANSVANHDPSQKEQLSDLTIASMEAKTSEEKPKSITTGYLTEGVPDEIVPVLDHAESFDTTKQSVMPTSAEPDLDSGVGLATNFTPTQTTLTPKLPMGPRVPPTQGLPRFPTADILYPTDQPIGIDDSMSFPPVFRPKNLTFNYGIPGPPGLLLPFSRGLSTDKPPSLFHSTGCFLSAGNEPRSMEVTNSYSADSSYQQDSVHTYPDSTKMHSQHQQPGSPDLGRTIEDSSSEQAMQNPTPVANVIPGRRGDGNTTIIPLGQN